MQLTQILLPVYAKDGRPFASAQFDRVRKEITDRFGGLTAYSRAPAEGLWRKEGATGHDDILVLEVMTANFDMTWWKGYRVELERRFQQDKIIIRTQTVRVI